MVEVRHEISELMRWDMRSFLCFCSVVLLICQSSVAQDAALDSVDSNTDGKVTLEEFKSYAQGRLQGFDKIDQFAGAVDADGNGEISEKEFGNRMQVLQEMANGSQEAEEKAEEETKDDGPLKVGDKATDFELQSIDKKIKLSDRFGEDGKPVVVVFSRANW